MSKPALGFIGLGRMGAPMASRLLAAGYAVTLFDTAPAAMQALAPRGARLAASPSLIVWGLGDRVLPPSVLERFREALPRASSFPIQRLRLTYPRRARTN